MRWGKGFEVFRRSRAGRWALRYIWLFAFLGIAGDFIANERPLYGRIEGESYFPILAHYGAILGVWKEEGRFVQQGWRDQPYEAVWFPLIPYSPETIDRRNLGAKSPFGPQRVSHWRDWHWLGTDTAGHDVAAGLIYGTRVAMLVGLIGMLTATLLGIILGGLSGFFGDEGLQTGRLRLIVYTLAVGVGIYFSWAHVLLTSENAGFWEKAALPLAVNGFLAVAVWGAARVLRRFAGWDKPVRVPLDFMVSRAIEALNALPVLLIILGVLAVVAKPSVYYVMLIIGCLRWTGIARLVRAEMLRIRDLQYIEAAKVLGLGKWWIWARHALPNGLRPVWAALAFGMAGAILVEASLSFLGIGLPVEMVTWGSLMRQLPGANLRPWWLAVFPGAAIFMTVLAFNALGEALADKASRL
jgi:peptide/nickel transport system permease protein